MNTDIGTSVFLLHLVYESGQPNKHMQPAAAEPRRGCEAF